MILEKDDTLGLVLPFLSPCNVARGTLVSILVKYRCHYFLPFTDDRRKDLETILVQRLIRLADVVSHAIFFVPECVAASRMQPVNAKAESQTKSSSNVAHAVETAGVQSDLQDSLASTPYRTLQLREVLVEVTKLIGWGQTRRDCASSRQQIFFVRTDRSHLAGGLEQREARLALDSRSIAHLLRGFPSAWYKQSLG